MKRGIIAAVVVVVAAVIAWQVTSGGGEESAGRFEFTTIERGDIENIISSTGTLSAVGMVEVGTQVSGTIDRLLVDYNEAVREGQVLAVLDTTMLSASVRDARAGVMRTQALYDQAARDYSRNEDMHARELISDEELLDSRTAMETARASLLSSQASLDRVRANLKYAVIRSPIDGKVIMRNVEPGQTVAASFSTPTLFVIAGDMEEMEIHALVDESDIGQIRVGQRVRFTVEAYIDEYFEGVVRQIWLQPQTIQNVVTYTVVVDALNDRGLLYPGMTATTDFLIDERRDVLMVSNAAIRFQPSPSMFEELRANMDARMAAMPDSEREAIQERMARRGGPGGGPAAAGSGAGGAVGGMAHGGSGSSNGNSVMIWYVDEAGRLAASRATKGVSDGRMTELVGGRGLGEGMDVIVSVSETESENGSSNPLATSPFGRRR